MFLLLSNCVAFYDTEWIQIRASLCAASNLFFSVILKICIEKVSIEIQDLRMQTHACV